MVLPRLLLLLLAMLAAPAATTAAGPVGEPDRGWAAGARGGGTGFAYQVFSSRMRDESFQRYEARGIVAASPETLFRAVRAITSDPTRAPEGQTRRVLSSTDDEFFVHTHIDLPAFFHDRDIVTRGVRTRVGDALRIDWEAVAHPEAPPSEDAVRIERSAGFWTFEPGVDGATRVVYATYVDVAGSLPGWLIRPLTRDNVARVFEQVATEALRFTEAAHALR